MLKIFYASVSKRELFNFFILSLFFLAAELSFADAAKLDVYFHKHKTHTLRVATTVIRLLSDQDFLNANPEFKSIAAKAKSALQTSLVHDKAKGLDAAFNKVLAEVDGFDYRSLPDSDPRKKKIIEAVNQLNARDEVFWKRAIMRFSLSSKKRHLLEQLVGAADYHDVPMSRVAEFGDGKIRKIDKASDWIPKLTHLSTEDRSGMTRVAQYLEKNPEKFKDIYTDITPKNLAQNGTKTYMKALKNHAKAVQKISRPVSTTYLTAGSRAFGVAGMLVAPAMVTYDYVKDPVYSKPGAKFVEIISASSELAKCQTIGCARVFKECKEKQWGEEKCLGEFLKKPLHEQTKLRLTDDLNLILRSTAPLVVNLTCDKTDANADRIKFSIANYNNELQKQELTLDATAKIQNIKISPPNGTLRPADLIQFTNGEPNNLILYQKPRVSKYSTNGADWSSLTIPKKDWTDKKMYFWTSGTPEQKTQIKRSQETLRSIRHQKPAMLACCASNPCRSYFSQLENNRQQNESRITQTPKRAVLALSTSR